MALQTELCYEPCMGPVDTKFCASCKMAKPRDDFAKNRSTRDGLTRSCRSCHSSYTRSHYARNKGYYLDKARARELKLREIINQAKDRPCMDCDRCFPG